jgi:hypothetical protein
MMTLMHSRRGKKYWNRNKEPNIFDIFPTFEGYYLSDEAEANKKITYMLCKIFFNAF